MLDITWLRPKTVQEAAEMLAAYGDEGRLVAGGTWVSLVLKQGLLMPSALIHLDSVPGLKEIEWAPGKGLRIGALVTHRAVELSPVVRRRFPVLAETFESVANVRVRCQATAGGVLCDADYASDPPAALAALNASVEVYSSNGQRIIPVRELITGHYSTELKNDEVLTHINVPEPAGEANSCGGVYLKYRTRSHEDRPCVGVAAVLRLHPDGRCADLQVVVGAVAGTPRWVEPAMEMARGRRLSAELIAEIAEQYRRKIEPLADLRASSEYRRAMVGVFVRRAISGAVQRTLANGGRRFDSRESTAAASALGGSGG